MMKVQHKRIIGILSVILSTVTWARAGAYTVVDTGQTKCYDMPLRGSGNAGPGPRGRGGPGSRDLWDVTLGDTQYQWFKKTLEESKTKYQFVFTHHILGTGRGAVENSDVFEWGGKNRRGDWEFDQKRPGWQLPIHQLMVKHGITIFSKGHNHLFARQERDGIVYQELPMPADPSYTTQFENQYRSGVKLPNSGHVRVAVSPDQVKVDYVRSYLSKDENDQRKNGDVAHSYTIKLKNGKPEIENANPSTNAATTLK